MNTEMKDHLPNTIRKWAKAIANAETASPLEASMWAKVDRAIDGVIYELSTGPYDSAGMYEYRAIREAAHRLAGKLLDQTT